MARRDGAVARIALIALAVVFLGSSSCSCRWSRSSSRRSGDGLGTYFEALSDPDTLAAIDLTLLVAAIAVPLNIVFGVAAAWAIAKFDFHGKTSSSR